MGFKLSGPFVLAFVLLGNLGIDFPARANVPFSWAHINSMENRVDLISATGITRSANPQDCILAGDTLNTNTSSQAELLFNDGSLARIGSDAVFRFWPETRHLELAKGTALLFVPPEQGRTSIRTPNAVVGLQNNAVVVRYVPIQNLTLVMGLANPETGPLALSIHASDQDYTLAAGQMAFINDVGIQVVEFDLHEFYQTSNLVVGLHLNEPDYENPVNDPIAPLRSDLLQALAQQQPFSGSSPILDPEVISNTDPSQTLFGDDATLLLPSAAPHESGDLGRYEEAPPGVVAPMLEPPTEGEQPETPIPETGETADPGNQVPAPPANTGP
jgi:hypothetical protein